jgi:hypothetical protein
LTILLYTRNPIPKIPVHTFHLENIVKSCFWGPSEAEGPQQYLFHNKCIDTIKVCITLIPSACLKVMTWIQLQSSVNSTGYCSSIYRQSYSFVRYYIHTLNNYIQGLQTAQGQHCHLSSTTWTTPSPCVTFLLHRDEACFVVLSLIYIEAFLITKVL